MNINNLDYHLPSKQIAQIPLNQRDKCKLLLIDRKNSSTSHNIFYNLINYLTVNDVLVLNNTKVINAKMFAQKLSNKKIELLLTYIYKDNISFKAIRKGKLKINDVLIFKKGIKVTVIKIKNYEVVLKIINKNYTVNKLINDNGSVPLPPYISNNAHENDLREKYNTIFAKKNGSIASPTAGLHFTKNLLNKIKTKGVQIEFVTLHVGLGTFLPIKTKNIKDHVMHKEYFEVSKSTVNRLKNAKIQGKRIIAVGTTVLRVLETISKDINTYNKKLQDTTNIFIYPPYSFKMVDALITNFHLPKTTLLALVSAFVSYPNTKNKFKNFNSSLIGIAYRQAIKNNYRFYSFGDAMFIF